MTETLTLDVNQVLRDKAKKHYNKIPKFAIRYLKRLIHEDDLNGIIERNKDKYDVDFMNALVEKEFNLKLNIYGEENIPKEGLFVFASNHPLGGLDGICLSSTLGKKYSGKIRYLVNDVLLSIKNLENIFVPINKYGGQAKESVNAINKAYESDNQIITFPAGLCSRKQNGKVEDLAWMKNFITKAIKYKRDIIPVHFDTQNSNLFYNLANIRKWLRIKFNIELILLPREMFKAKNKTFNITFGKPISWQSLKESKNHIKLAEEIKEIVYSLKQGHNNLTDGNSH